MEYEDGSLLRDMTRTVMGMRIISGTQMLTGSAKVYEYSNV